MAIIPQIASAAEDRASGAQVIDGSLRFNPDNHLKRTISTAGNGRIFTLSAWVKHDSTDSNDRILGNYTDGNNYASFYFRDTPDYQISFVEKVSSAYLVNCHSTRMARDPSSWYHVVWAIDTSQGTAANRVKLYVNGIQETVTGPYSNGASTGAATFPTEDYDTRLTGAYDLYVGDYGNNASWDGNMSQVYFIDGQALDATYFGFTDPLTGTWRPKKFIPPYKPNSGQSWSGMCSGGTDSGYEHTKAFDGADNTNCYPSPGSTVTMTIPAGKLKYTTSFKAWVSRDINGGVITVNGGSNVTPSGSGFQIVDLSGQVAAGADITQITWARAGSGSIGIAMIYIMIDGVALLDDDYSNFGGNGFYFPMDGNSPIGKDKSRRGNDFTPINFGGSTVIPKATGALPILNTVNGGRAASAGVRTDAFGNNCVLALPLTGDGTLAANDVSNQINSGSTTKAVTTNGNPTASTTQSNFYGGSFDFDASGDYFNTTTSSTDFSFGTGDFTIEAWCFVDSGADNKGLWQLSTTSGGLVNSSTTLSCNYESDEFFFGSAGGWRQAGRTYNDATWHHVAEVRNGGTIYIYVDGVLDQSWSDTSTYDMTYWAVGGYYTTSYLWSGYIQDFRVYKGVAKYTSNFIPASSNPDVVPDSPSGVAYSSELTKTTSGSVSFDGADDYLTIEDHADLDFGGSDFCVELWIYPMGSGNSGYGYLIDKGFDFQFSWMENDGSNKHTLALFASSDGSNYDIINSANITGNWSVGKNRWSHIALARDGSTWRCFINGVQKYSSALGSTINGNSTALSIGTYLPAASNYEFKGNISNVRIVKGSPVYTSNFIPPTSPLTNITNTKLLCCQGSSVFNNFPPISATAKFNLPLSSAPFTDSSSNSYTVTNTGSVTTASAGTNRFNITNAASFDGSSQRLNMNSNVTLTGDWTIDAWIKLDSSASGYNAIYNSGYTSSNNTYIYMSVNDDEKPYLEGGSAGGSTIAANAINKNQWYHFRATQDAGGMHLYVDGEKVVTHGKNTTDMSSLGTDCIGSLVSNGNNANNFDGLIGPVRYVSSTLGAPPVGGLPTTAGALSNTPVVAMGVAGHAKASTFNPFDTDIDTVTGKSGQYCRWNALWKNSTQTNGDKVPVLRNGNLNVVFASGESTNTFKSVCGTIAIDSTKGGKWYYETSSAGGIYNQIGMCREDYLWQVNKDGWGIAGSGMGLTFSSGGNWSINKGSLWTNLTTWSTYGQLVSFLIDFDNNTVNAWVDGIEVAYTVDISSYVKDWAPFWYPMISLGYNTGNCTGDETSRSNFGQRPFKFTPPEGYQPICEANMSSPGTTNLPDKYFTTFSYNGSSATTFRKLGLEADLVWIKSNYDNVGGWNCLDTVRGASQTVQLNTNAAQTNETGNFVSFDKEGVTVTGSANAWNGSGDKFVIYAWAAGGSKGTFNKDGNAYSTAATAGLTAGDITPTGSSINTKTGFSIIQYTAAGNGDRVPHGLTQTPDFLITKVVSSPSDDWSVYTTVVDGSYDYFVLNGTNAKTDSGQTAFNATTFPNVWGSGKTIINYAWHSVPGVQKFGRFTGTNAADGPFIYLGFQPAVIILKESSGGSAWTIKCNNAFDNVYATTLNHKYTGTTNPVGNQMYLNTTAIDEAKSAAYGKVDFLSNGFKPRVAGQSVNSAATYIYMAWAAEPFHNLYGGSATAR